MKTRNYKNFGLMMALSFIIMYAVMYLNVYRVDHIYLNLTRFYMTVLMICPMSVLMLIMMKSMYPNRKVNAAIIAGASLLFFSALTLVRTQTPVDDIQYMKGMIPHHSIAILTSKNANIKDLRVRKLANGIIATQEKEIKEMKTLIQKMKLK